MSKPTDWLPSLNALRAFEAVARNGGFNKAASELRVTSPAVQQLVRGLEEALDRRLVTRHGRSLSVSAAGQAALPHLSEGFAQIAEAVRRLRSFEAQRVVKVSVEPSFASSWLLGRLARFQDRHNGIDVLIDASARIADLRREDFDLAVRYRAQQSDGHITFRLFDDETVAVCAPALLRDQEAPMTFEELGRHVLVHFEGSSGNRLQPDWASWLGAFGVRGLALSRNLRFTDYNLMLQSVLAGHGIGLASRPLVQDALDAGHLVTPFRSGVKAGYGYDVLALPAVVGRPEVRAFLDWIAAEAGKAAGP